MPFISKPFSQLTAGELHAAYSLRSRVFVVEQNCPYQDPDEKDPLAEHVLLFIEDQLAAYARLLPADVSYQEPSIGRVVVSPEFRGRGLGQELMNYSMQQARALFGNLDLVISAQLYLLRFYTDLGFAAEGEEYDEDGIPHIQMRLKAV